MISAKTVAGKPVLGGVMAASTTFIEAKYLLFFRCTEFKLNDAMSLSDKGESLMLILRIIAASTALALEYTDAISTRLLYNPQPILR